MQAWYHFIAVQEAALGKDVVDQWLRPLKILRFDACNLYLEASDSFQALWFEEHIRPLLKQNLLNHNQTSIKVHLTVSALDQLPRSKFSPKPRESETSSTFSLTFDHPDPSCSLENFVVTPANELAYRLFVELCRAPSEQLGSYNPIFIYGDHGSGKTHLLAAVTHDLSNQGFRVIYVRAETFTEHVVNAIRAGEMHVFRETYRHADLLIIDNVHIFARKHATQEELFHTFNTLHVLGKQIILCAHCPPGALPYIEPRLISRFEWGITLEITALKQKELLQLIQNKCEALSFPLNSRVQEFIVETFQSSPKAIIKALEALILRSHISTASIHSSTGITINQARLYLADLTQLEKTETITKDKILKQVAKQFGIKTDDILGSSQNRECALPRHLAAYLCRTLLKMPFKKIGDFLDRDHSTIMSSVKQIQKQVDANMPEILSPLKAIQTALKNPSSSEAAEQSSTVPVFVETLL